MIQEYDNLLKEIIESASRSILEMSKTDMEFKSAPEKWSKKQILGHLIDSGVNNFGRFVRGATGAILIFDGYDQVKWVVVNNYQGQELASVVHRWAAINESIAELLPNIEEEVFHRKTTEHNFDRICMKTIEKGIESNLHYLIWDYIFHLEHHLSQIIPNYQRRLKSYPD